jgi:putative hemolysin
MLDTFQNAERTEPKVKSIASDQDFVFSYSCPQFPLARRMMIKSVEALTGQRKLEKLYRNWSVQRSQSENIFAAAMRLLNIDLQTDYQAWRRLPKEGPLLVMANHPYGVLDGLAIGFLTTLVRSDVKIMTHSLLCQASEVRRYMLPVDFSGTQDAQRTSLRTRKAAVDWLKDGHVVVVFPAGGVSTSVKPFAKHAVDCAWHPFVAKLARLKGITIAPVFFDGQNSRAFQVASHVSYPLRLALLFRETVQRMGKPLKVTIGEPVQSSDLPEFDERQDLMRHLRRLVYGLSDLGPKAGVDEFVFPKRFKFN